MSVGTTPDSIQVVDTMAMHSNIGTAGRIWRALRRSPRMAPRRLSEPQKNAMTQAMIAEINSATGLYSDMAEGPSKIMMPTMAERSRATGTKDQPTEGARRPGVRLNILFNMVEPETVFYDNICTICKNGCKITKKLDDCEIYFVN